jgi:multidrug efflux system membrane fusion protein
MRPGIASQVTILTSDPEERIHIPERAVLAGDGGPAVEVVRPGGDVERVPIELGPRWDGRVIVTAGLSPGDRVLVGGSDV